MERSFHCRGDQRPNLIPLNSLDSFLLMNVQIRLLGPTDLEVLQHVDSGVFDHPVRTEYTMEFLQDSRHHIAVAIGEEGNVIGMASAFHYVHPDKQAQLFINEIGVAKSFRRRGVGRQLVSRLVLHARQLGCYECWVAT